MAVGNLVYRGRTQTALMRNLSLILLLYAAGALAGCTGATGGSGNNSPNSSSSSTSSSPSSNATAACSAMTVGQGAGLNGFLPFPADNAWNKDVSTAPVDANSAAIINFIGPTVTVHPDFGSGLYQGAIIGVPYMVVGPQQGGVNISYTAYGSESDPSPMPIPANALD